MLLPLVTTTIFSKQGIYRNDQRDDGEHRGIGEGGEAPLLNLHRFHIDDVIGF